jgi:hypothetical protein
MQNHALVSRSYASLYSPVPYQDTMILLIFAQKLASFVIQQLILSVKTCNYDYPRIKKQAIMMLLFALCTLA